MDDGIYSISLTSHDEPIGEGIVVVKDGTMNGAGSGYLWTGFYDQKEETIRCEVRAYRKFSASIFGEKACYVLRLQRDKLEGELFFSGLVPHDPLRTVTVELVWLGCLAKKLGAS